MLAERKINGNTRRSTRSWRASDNSIFGDTYGWMRVKVSGRWVGAAHEHFRSQFGGIGEAVDEDLVDVDANLEVVVRGLITMSGAMPWV